MITTITNDFVPTEIVNTIPLESINYLDIEIPYFKNIRTPYYGYPKTLHFFIDKVKNDRSIREDVLAGRSCGKGHPDYEIWKKDMPVIVPSVIYRNLDDAEKSKGINKVKGNVSHLNGLWCVDIDVKEAEYDKYGKIVKKSENINIDLKTILENDPYTLVSCKSFGGKGYTSFLYCEGIDLSNSLEFYFSIEQYFKDTYNIIIDPSRKNVNGLRILTHDENLFYNPKPKHFTWDGVKRDFKTKVTTTKDTDLSFFLKNNSFDVIESSEDWKSIINTIKNYNIPLWEGYQGCLSIATFVPPFYFEQLCSKFRYKTSWNLIGKNTTVFKIENLNRLKNLAKQKGVRFRSDEKLKKVEKKGDFLNAEIVNESKTQLSINQNDSGQLRLLANEISAFNYSNDGIQLKEGEYLGYYKDKLKIIARERIIHLWQVPAGFGKTELIKDFAKTYRVLVAVPIISIIRNKFENDITYKDDFKFCYDSGGIKAQLDSKKPNGRGHSIVSTFDQLSYINDISSIASRFDYIFIDESHELTLSYYRLKCTGKLITNLSNYATYLQNPIYKNEHEATPPASLILMTGTPCGEQQLLGIENVRLTRFLPKKNKKINLMVCGDREDTFNRFVKKLQEILSNENSLVFIPCNLGEIWIITLMELVGCEDYMIYSKNQSKTENAKFIDENSLIPENIKVIFGTKSAGCGLDFNNTDKKVSVLFYERLISAYIEQFISRFRKVDVDAFLFVQTKNAKGHEFDFGFDGNINKPYEYEFDEADFYYKKQAYLNSKNTEDFGKSGAEMEAWNDDFVLNGGISKQNEFENRRYTYSKMYHKTKQYEVSLEEHENKLYHLCGGLMRLNYEPKLIKTNYLHDNKEVSADFKKLRSSVILRKNLRLKRYFESLLPYAEISFKGWKFEVDKELKIEMELKTVMCPNLDEIKFIKKYLFKFFDLKPCESFIRNEMTYFNELSKCELIKFEKDLKLKIKFYKFCKDSKDVVISFIDSVYNFWFNKSYTEIEVLEWKKNMTSSFLVNNFFELDEKTQKNEIERFNEIFDVFGTIKREKKRFTFIPIRDYEQLKTDIDNTISLLFNLEPIKSDLFRKVEEFKGGKKKGISFDHMSEEMLTEIKTKMKKGEGLIISELKEMTGLDNGKEIDVFLKQFRGVNKKRVRINKKQEMNYFIFEL